MLLFIKAFLYIYTMGPTFWANPDGTVYPESQIGIVRNILAGDLVCSGRLIDIQRFQSWCYNGTRLLTNQVSSLSDSSMLAVDYNDDTPDSQGTTVMWLLAYVEGNPKTVAYQVGISVKGVTKPYITGQF